MEMQIEQGRSKLLSKQKPFFFYVFVKFILWKYNPGESYVGKILLSLQWLYRIRIVPNAATNLCFCFLHLISPSVYLHCSVNMILSQHSPNKPISIHFPKSLANFLKHTIVWIRLEFICCSIYCMFSIALSPRGGKAHLLAGLVWQSWLQHIQNSTLA